MPPATKPRQRSRPARAAAQEQPGPTPPPAPDPAPPAPQPVPTPPTTPAPQPTPTQILEGLSPEDRARLAREALAHEREQEQLQAIATATERDQRIRALLDEFQVHVRGCPHRDAASGRVEAFAQTRPPRPAQGLPAQPLTVIRCLECGGTDALTGAPDTYDL